MEERTTTSPAPDLESLPADELIKLAQSLGLRPDGRSERAALVRLVRERRRLIDDLDRDALLDVVKWMRIPVRPSESKAVLVAHVVASPKVRFEGLSDRGLDAVARLRGVEPRTGEPRASLEARVKRGEGFWNRVRRKRREWAASVVERLIEGERGSEEYRFLPEEEERRGLRERIENVGVVGGIARTLRGAADDYVAEKLDEIERRIDRKLEEIDRRLCEWRDREVSNRLRIVRLTLIGTVIVAALSLGYEYVKRRVASEALTQANRGATVEIRPVDDGAAGARGAAGRE